MNSKNILPLLAVLILCSSCGLNIANTGAVPPTPGFVTSTLPPTKIPLLTRTPLPTTPTAVVIEETAVISVEGTTTTQLNVRAEPSTASETLGIINQFAAVQVIGKDASGSWFQIIYAESEAGKGWVRAEYVQVKDAAAEIPILGSVTGSGSGVSGLVIQKVNVRNGPGINFESLGVLNPNDVIFITGKDASDEWLQIEYTNAVDGKGWAAVKYLQVEGLDSIPVIGAEEQATETPSAVFIPAFQDGDSMQAPMAAAVFSAAGTRVLQVNGDVSSPDGDREDWIQFTPYTQSVSFEAKCAGGTLRVELWHGSQLEKDIAPACGENFITTTPGQVYFLRLQTDGGIEALNVQYKLKISSLE
ncbi:MAG: SH3 domain-containing protein [Chloroflexi bacterium]|nr:SH3 domain-containing protein [Chloroflexota bacterium]